MTRDEAFQKARGMWGGNACIHEEMRRNDEGTSIMYSVGTGGDIFNWRSLGQGWSYEDAFAEAITTLAVRRPRPKERQ